LSQTSSLSVVFPINQIEAALDEPELDFAAARNAGAAGRLNSVMVIGKTELLT
jgi:hypothetical protein